MKGAADFWKRAGEWLVSARTEEAINPDASASCSYYAAMYALSALFTLEGKVFTSHDGIEVVLHRDFIKPGLLPREIGEHFKKLRNLRKIGNYGCEDHVSREDARRAIELARALIEAVHGQKPDVFSRLDWMQGS